MSDERDPTDDTEEPAGLGDVVARLLGELFEEPASGGAPDKLAVDLEAKLDDAFELIRDAASSALGELGSALDQLSSRLADATTDASGQLAGLADAIGGAGSLQDAVERVAGQLGATPAPDDGDEQTPKRWEDLGIALDDIETPEDDGAN